MDKISKLEMFQSLADAQGIQAVVNTGTYSSPTPAPVPSPTLAIETSIHACKVDLADVATVLIVEKPTSHPNSTKRARDEENQSPWAESSSKELASLRTML